jgi:hypothetical protein
MLYYIGVFFILILNAGILFDQAHHNKELNEENPYVFFIVMGLFASVEIIFFTAIYFLTIKVTGLI